jgi:hypothetical protein
MRTGRRLTEQHARSNERSYDDDCSRGRFDLMEQHDGKLSIRKGSRSR